MLQVIALSGTPGTGKTGVGQELARRLNAKFVEISQLAQDQQLLIGKDTNRETLIVDVEKLQKYLMDLISDSQERYVIVGHFADVIPEAVLHFLVVLRCDPVVLTQRLRNRQWTEKKILENIQAEILGECTAQALSLHHRAKIFEIDTTEISVGEVVDDIEEILAGHSHKFTVGQISWLRTLDPQKLHEIMEKNTLPSKS